MSSKPIVTAATGILLSLALVGCGGSSATAAGPSEGDDIDDGGGAPLPADPQAEQAARFCEHAISRSEVQPPDSLDRKQIAACLTAIKPRMQQKCSKGIAREVVLKIIVEKTGEVSDAFGLGDGADSPEASCVAELVKGVRFPQFKGAAQQVISKYPFTLTP
jgi:hypothetical protein